MPPIGLTMIARGAEKTLPTCLDSLAAYVDPIVVVCAGKPTDDTEGAARRYTDHVFHWEAALLPDGGVASFAAARNFSLEKLVDITGPDAWWLWVDADDTVEHADQLAELVKVATEKKVQGVWLPYLYSFIADGSCTTLFIRERLLYDPTHFFWHNRVHEIIVPKVPVSWMNDERVLICHNQHAGGSRTKRNMALLEMMYQENPNDPRTLFYLGHQNYADRNWAEAARWYQAFVQKGYNKPDMWQAYVYLQRCLRKMEKLDDALQAGLIAVGMFPRWKDSWYDLAETFAYRSEWESCIFARQVGDQAESPSKLLFQSPLEQTGYAAGKFEEVALYQLGRVEEALERVKELQEISDDDHLKAKRMAYEEILDSKQRAEAWLTVMEGKKPAKVVELGKDVPQRYFAIPEVRDAVNGARLALRREKVGKARGKAKGKDIAIFCGPSLEDWTPKSLNVGGIGGSETAVIEIARRFAADGYRVDVYNQCGKAEGEYDGVGYWEFKRFNPQDPYDLLVAWRQPMLVDAEPKAKRTWLWMHDLHAQERLNVERARAFEYVLGVSQYHVEDLLRRYDFLPEGRVDFVPNGIDMKRFEGRNLERQRHKVVWLSSPDRGLDALLSLWPYVKRCCPEAELHVFYGFNNLERPGPGAHDFRMFVDLMRSHMERVGAIERGRVGQQELADELLTAWVWPYITAFCETACIAAMEAMAAGVPIVYSAVGALPFTVGKAGIGIPGHARNDQHMHVFLGNLLAVMLEDDVWLEFHEKSLERAPMWTWDNAYKKWQELLTRKEN